MVDSVWQFDGESCKAVLINASIEFDELKKIICDRFQVDAMTHDIRFTHSNTTPSLKPFDLSSTADLQTFFSINKMAHIAWSTPLCVSLVKKLNENLTESGASGSVPTNIIEVVNRDVTEPELQGDSVDCNEEVMDIESHEQPRALNRFIELGQTFKSKEEVKTALSLHAFAESFEFRVRKSTKSLVLAGCIQKECKWRLRAVKVENLGLFLISKYIGKHTCALETRHAHQIQPTYQVIADRIKAMHQGVGRKLTTKQIVNIMRTEYNITASYWKCWRAHAVAQGKQPKKRKRDEGPPKKVEAAPVGQVRRNKCSKCGVLGHNKKTCINQLSSS